MNGFGYTGPTGPSGQLTYLLPSTGNVWVHLGTLTTTMNGNLTQLEIGCQNEYATTDADFVLARLLFTSTNGTISQQALDDNTNATSPFFGVARAYCAGNLWDNSNFALTQTGGQGSNVGTFQFYMIMPPSPGRSWLAPTICPGDSFVFSGTVLNSEVSLDLQAARVLEARQVLLL